MSAHSVPGQTVRSLQTTDRCEAIVRAWTLAAQSDQLFGQFRLMTKTQVGGWTTRQEMVVALGGFDRATAIKVNVEEHETAAVQAALNTILGRRRRCARL